LLNSTRLGPGAEHEQRAADYPESREGYRGSAHKDYPGCAALASSNCAYPYVRSLRWKRPLLLQCGNFGL
jgi:hypothetical protein